MTNLHQVFKSLKDPRIHRNRNHKLLEPSSVETQQTQERTNLSEIEKNAILRAIEKHSGNVSKAAKEHGLTRTALYRRLDKYDI